MYNLYMPKAVIRFGATLLMVLFSALSFAQTPLKIQVLDKNSNEPIVGVAYQSGDIQGVSDENGMIVFISQSATLLTLQHINYGKQQFKISELLGYGTIYLTAKGLQLQPVAVIGVNHGIKNDREFSLTTADQVNHDAGQILSSLPEIAGVRKSAAYGFDPVFRGFTGDQLNIVLDGNTKAIAACPNRMDPPTSQVSPNMIESVEVLKGPYSLRYGNSFGATLQYKTTKNQFSENGKWGGRLTDEYNENGNANHTEAKLGYSSSRLAIHSFASYGQGGDYLAGDAVNVAAGFKRGSVGVKAGVKLSSLSQLDLSATRNFARDTDFPTLMMDLRSDDTWLINTAYKWANATGASALSDWTTQAYYTNVDHTMDNLGKIMPTRMVNAITDATTETFGLRNEAKLDLNGKMLLTGLDYNFQTANGIRSREMLMGPMAGRTMYDNAWQGGQIQNIGLFGEYHFAVPTVDYVLAGRLDSNFATNTDADQNFNSIYTNDNQATQFNPSISFGAVKHFANKVDGSLWLGRAQRSASLTERYINFLANGLDPYEMVGNPELDAEVNYQIDAKVTKQYRNASWEVNAFASKIDNYIQGVVTEDLSPRIPSSPGVRQFQNIGGVLKYGFEAGASHQINTHLNQQVLMAYTWGEDLERNNPLAQIAPFDMRYKLRGNFFESRLKPEAQLRYVGAKDRVSTEYRETVSPEFAVVDLGASYQIHNLVNISAGVKNLLDQHYYEFLNRPIRMGGNPLYSPGRSAHLAVSLDF